MGDEALSKRRGRPCLPASVRRRHNQTFRVDDEMLVRLKVAADSNQRSLSEEVEHRLRDSFGPNEVMKAALREVLNERREIGLDSRTTVHIQGAGNPHLVSKAVVHRLAGEKQQRDERAPATGTPKRFPKISEDFVVGLIRQLNAAGVGRTKSPEQSEH